MNKPDQAFCQKQYFYKHRIFSFMPGGLLKIIRKTPGQAFEWTVNLAHVNPESRTLKLRSSFFFNMMLFCLFGLVLMVLMQGFDHHASFFDQAFWQSISVYAVVGLISGVRYLTAKEHYTVFHYMYESEPLAFAFNVDQPNHQAYQNFVDEIKEQIKQARIQSKEQETECAVDAIEFLRKEHVINEEVSAILHYRLDDMNYFANE